MKLGILGTGMIVKDLLTIFDKLDLESAYILGTEKTIEETEALKSKYHLDKTFYDYDELLASDIDTVYCALPNFLHFAFAKKALEHDKHVIIEKPITTNYKELQELDRIAKKHHRIMLEAMNIHYLPAYKTLKEQVDKIGKIKIVSFNYSQYSSRYDAFKEGKILPAFDYKKAGGALMDLNVYNFHAIIGLFGEPKEVRYLANIERKIDTSGVALLDYGLFKAVSIGAKDCKAPLTNTIQGDKGYIIFSHSVNQLHAFKVVDNAGKEKEYNFDPKAHRLIYEFQEFIKIIDGLDYERSYEMLEISMQVSKTMKLARNSSDIKFGSEL